MASRHVRIPTEVLTSAELSHTDVRVFGALAMHAIGGNIVTIGQRRLAELARVDRRTIRKSLKVLAKQGHISTAITKLLKRNVYCLHSPIYLPDSSAQLGGEERPMLGVEKRPRIDIENAALVSFPKRLRR